MMITCFGDSITFGEFVPRRSTWVHLLSILFPHHDVVNKGVCAETSRQALERSALDIGRSPPDVLLIQYGLNDMNPWETELGLPRVLDFAYGSNLRELVARAVFWGVPQNQIILLGPTTARRPHVPEAIPRYETYMFQAADFMGVAALSLAHVGKEFDELMPDGVHLSTLGHDRYLHSLLPILNPMLK